jgi:hypothetical protein
VPFEAEATLALQDAIAVVGGAAFGGGSCPYDRMVARMSRGENSCGS